MRKGIVLALLLSVLTVFAVHVGIVGAAEPIKQKQIIFKNMSGSKAEVNVNFDATGEINTNNMDGICTMRKTASQYNCGFDLDASGPKSQVSFPNSFRPISMAVAFNKYVGCGSTKAEITVNWKKGPDSMDVSLVDGFNEKIQIIWEPKTGGQKVTMGPPCGKDGNERVYGVFPYGCDHCTFRGTPQKDCGPYPPGNTGCKKDKDGKQDAASEYKADPICQYNFNSNTEKDGTMTIILLPKNASCTRK